VVALLPQHLHCVWTLDGVVHNGLDVRLIRRTREALLNVREYARGGH
jgi:hypothetical protein